jgi:hypothetical protein
MSADFIFRILGMIGFAIGGALWGKDLGVTANMNATANNMTVDQYSFVIGAVGALVGLILTPYITTRQCVLWASCSRQFPRKPCFRP